MKKAYLQPQIFKYDSLVDITMATGEGMEDDACTNSGPGCSGSCIIGRTVDQPNWVGYKTGRPGCGQ